MASLPCRSKVADVGDLDGRGEQADDFSNDSAFEHPDDFRCGTAGRSLTSYVGAGVRFAVDIRTRAMRYRALFAP